MRIRNSGSGSFGSGTKGGRNRKDSFKKDHQSGQKVRGTLLKWVSEDMAWVNIDGHKLLAQLQSRPPVGASLTFIIKQLQPEIILKEVFEVSGAASSVITLASDFDTSRTLFENQFRTHALTVAEQPPSSRRVAFTRLLAEHAKLLSTFLDAAACLKAIQHHLGTQLDARLHYSPWIAPTARRHVGLVRTQTSNSSTPLQTTEECEYDALGMLRTEFLCKADECGYKLYIQNVADIKQLKTYLGKRTHPWLDTPVTCYSISKLPPNKHGGLIAELMFKQ